MRRRFLATLFFTLALPVVVAACIWDYDTLKMERQRFPGTLEVITGKFLRHSPAFYEWRVKDRLAKIEKDPSVLSNYDDLAVAYHKLGQTDKAIEWMQKKDKLKPGLYETEANLSAFYMLSGQWEKGLEHVNKALAINPNAHFGREKYQKYLALYVRQITQANGGKLVLPMAKFSEATYQISGFSEFLEARGEKNNAEAIQAVSGMIVFAGPDAPLLLDALGSLLLKDNSHGKEDAKQLAARAFLRAAGVSVGEEMTKYRDLAKRALNQQVPSGGELKEMALKELEKPLQAELKEAQAWIAQIEANEKQWIAGGKDPEAEFGRVYYQQPITEASEGGVAWDIVFPRSSAFDPLLVAFSIVALVAAAVVCWMLVLRRSRHATNSPTGEASP